MSVINGMPVNFSISASAWTEIERIKSLYQKEKGVEPSVLSIAWGEYQPNNSEAYSGIVFGYYTIDERINVIDSIEIIDEKEIVFFITEKNYKKFEGKTIKFSEEIGIFME